MPEKLLYHGFKTNPYISATPNDWTRFLRVHI